MKRSTIIGILLLGLVLGSIAAPRYFTGQTASPQAHGIQVSWVLPAPVANVTITGFGVWRAPFTGGTCGLYSIVQTVQSATATSWDDPASDLANNTSYCFEVQTLANNATGAANSGPSASAQATTPATWPGNANPPSGCTAKNF